MPNANRMIFLSACAPQSKAHCSATDLTSSSTRMICLVLVRYSISIPTDRISFSVFLFIVVHCKVGTDICKSPAQSRRTSSGHISFFVLFLIDFYNFNALAAALFASENA